MKNLASLESIERIPAFSRINEIQQRIKDIETKFATEKPARSFQTVLEEEMTKVIPIEEYLAANKVHSSNNSTSANSETLAVVDSPRESNSDETFSDETNSAENFGRNTNIPNPTTTEQMIEAAARHYGVESELVKAIATAESNMNQEARSHVGAIGVMQLMPSTAENLGVNPYDERQNIEGGAHYIRQMLDKFNGNVRNAIAAYNAGPGAVQKYGGIPPYRETQNYVGRVMDFYVR